MIYNQISISMKSYKISDFLTRLKRPKTLENKEDYQLVTIKLNHKGVIPRTFKKGSDIKSKMFEVKEGDFVLSGIDARNGAFGIVPNSLDGAIITNDFWCLSVDNNIINKHYFFHLTSTSWFDDICKRASDGTTQRIRLQKDKFFNEVVYLPGKDEQEKILEKLKIIENLEKINLEQSQQILLAKQLILNGK